MKASTNHLQALGPSAPSADPTQEALSWRATTLGANGGSPAVLGGESLRPTPKPGSELGCCYFREEWLTVYFHSSRAMWVCRPGGFTETVGLVRWDPGQRPWLVPDPREARLEHSEEIELIDLATVVWWAAVHGQQLDSQLPVAVHPDWRAAASADHPKDVRSSGPAPHQAGTDDTNERTDLLNG